LVLSTTYFEDVVVTPYNKKKQAKEKPFAQVKV
jgi:hypothetical protein